MSGFHEGISGREHDSAYRTHRFLNRVSRVRFAPGAPTDPLLAQGESAMRIRSNNRPRVARTVAGKLLAAAALATAAVLALALTSSPGSATQSVAPAGGSCDMPFSFPWQPGQGRVQSSTSGFRHASAWIYGDSITMQSGRMLALSVGGRRIAYDAQGGRQTVDAVNAALADLYARGGHPRAIIIASGTNDSTSPWILAQQVKRARAAIPARIRLLWVNVAAQSLWFPAATLTKLNAAIGGVRGVQVVDWSAYVAAGTPAGGRSPLLGADGIHLTCAGAVARNALIASAL